MQHVNRSSRVGNVLTMINCVFFPVKLLFLAPLRPVFTHLLPVPATPVSAVHHSYPCPERL